MIGVAKIATEKEVLEFFKSAYAPRKRSYYGFYNSMLGKVILNQHLMLLPVDERIATRAHGVFDVAYVKQSRIINLDSHLNRLYNSAASVSIVPPFSKE